MIRRKFKCWEMHFVLTSFGPSKTTNAFLNERILLIKTIKLKIVSVKTEFPGNHHAETCLHF